MKFKILAIFVLLFSVNSANCFANNCEERTREIYLKLVNSIGNKFDLPPELYLLDSNKKVAYINDEGIFIERKLIQLFCDKPSFEANIAYILGHELAHYYLEHNWMKNSGLGYSNSLGIFIDEKAYSKEQRKIAESQADLFGGFYGQIAGYSVLESAQETLKILYHDYQIPEEIKGYPSLNERYQIIESNLEKAKNLSHLFHFGNVLLSTGHLAQAKDCFEIILKNKFTSREIYNNLGLTYLLFAIKSLAPPFSKVFYPVYLDRQTRLNTGATRSSGFFGTPEQSLEKSKKYFSLSQELDPSYLPALQNILVYNYIMLVTSEKPTKEFLNALKSKGLDEKTINDFYVLDKRIQNKKIRNQTKYITEGSDVTLYNLGIKEPFKITTEETFEKRLEENGIKPEAYIFGFERPYTKHRFEYFRYKMSFKKYENGTLFDLNDEMYIYKQPKNAAHIQEGFLYKGDYYTVSKKR